MGSPQYFREVKRILMNDMDIKYGRLRPLHLLSFTSKYRKKLKSEDYSLPDPLFDAWRCVQGLRRPSFSVETLVMLYPSVVARIKEIRDVVKISLQTKRVVRR